VDIEDVTVTYPSIFELMQDLSDMGEENAVIGRCVLSLERALHLHRVSRHLLHRDTIMAAAAAYQGSHQSSRVTSADVNLQRCMEMRMEPSQQLSKSSSW
jgi:hypothetical protein